MSLEELAARMQVLEDIEAIKKLKHRYLRCLDGKLWEEMDECLANDIETSYFNDEMKTSGKEETMNFFRIGLSDDLVALHHGHHPEIEVTSDTTAKGIWGLYNYMIDKNGNRSQRVGGIYHETYTKVNNQWKIQSIICRQLFHESWERSDPLNAHVAFRGSPQHAAAL